MENKLAQIYQGYKNLLFKDEKVEEFAFVRLEICKECPERSNYPEEINIISTCNKCGCILKAKTRSEKAHCPLKKW